MTKFVLLPTLALILLACAPKPTARIMPEEATRRFVTVASVPEVLDAAVTTLESRHFSIIELRVTLVCAQREERDFYSRMDTDPAGVRPGRTDRTRLYWRLVRISAAVEDDSTLVTIEPSGLFADPPVRIEGGKRLEGAEALQAWCESEKRGAGYLRREAVTLSEELAATIKGVLREGKL